MAFGYSSISLTYARRNDENRVHVVAEFVSELKRHTLPTEKVFPPYIWAQELQQHDLATNGNRTRQNTTVSLQQAPIATEKIHLSDTPVVAVKHRGPTGESPSNALVGI